VTHLEARDEEWRPMITARLDKIDDTLDTMSFKVNDNENEIIRLKEGNKRVGAAAGAAGGSLFAVLVEAVKQGFLG